MKDDTYDNVSVNVSICTAHIAGEPH